jgi:hypothetical protein
MRETTIGSRVVKARAAAAYTNEVTRRARIPVVLRRVVITLLLIACAAGAVIAVQRTVRGDSDGVTESGDNRAPSVVKLISPADGSNVLSQAQIEIDLDTKYDANLVVNGIPIPSDQVQRHPELSQVLFSPGAGKVIDKYQAGTNCVVANIFRVDGTDDPQPPVHWCFQVT